MLKSAEVRWFIPGSIPEDVFQWFHAQHQAEAEKSRTDRYLLFSGCDAVGVKLRQKKLEIKARLAHSQPVSLPISLKDGMSGQAEQWLKWSIGSPWLWLMQGKMLRSARWLEVKKKRDRLTFSANANAAQSPSTPGVCNVELAQIQIPKLHQDHPTNWFSLCFEALGSSDDSWQTLHNTLHLFFTTHGAAPVPLTEATCMSYPTWLSKLSENLS